MSKTCSKCGKELPYECFCASKRSKDGLQCWCKACYKKHHLKYDKEHYKEHAGEKREYRKQNTVSIRNSVLKWKYDITLDQYDEMLAAQGGVCMICGRPETAKNQYGVKRLAVDHDHRTEKVRALLCSSCNTVLGLVNDDVEMLLKLGLYLEKYR